MNITAIRLISAIFIGILLGASGMNLYISNQYEKLIAKNRALEEELINTQKSLEELKGRLEQQQRKSIIAQIKPQLVINVTEDMPSYAVTSAKLDGEKKITELLEPFKGQEVNGTNFNLIARIIDGREFESEGRRYVLKVDVVVATEELLVFATADLLKTIEY
ncbi:hypothetical protein [Desulfofalx alkaliphila]|uniref:hypothetical protein n=1 Tax=Desulfofalx alkaliphila TaxID=105483 RepID=UPI0004E1B96C|nr:hypothetical protein [Desulfofalx alkaliphila]